MIVLGYSGLDGAEAYIKSNYIISKGEQRIVQGYDSAVSIIINGELKVCLAEERFTGIKQTGNFPINAIKKACEICNIVPDDIDYISHAFNYEDNETLYRLNNEKMYLDIFCKEKQVKLWKKYFGIDITKKLMRIPHHISHASSSYFLSGYKSCLCVVCDGMGERYSMTVYTVIDGYFNILKEYSIGKSLGILYSVFTKALGYEFNSDEYKVMGLAAYGNPEKYRFIFEHLISYKKYGDYHLDWSKLGISIKDDLFHRKKINCINSLRKEDNNNFQDSADLAAALQENVEKIMDHVLRYWAEETGEKYLCMAGGFFLNCSNNGKIINNNIFDDIYCQPAAGDDGSALGSALYTSFLNGEKIKIFSKLPLWGTKYSNNDIESILEKYSNKVIATFIKDEELLYKNISKSLNEGKIIAWFQDEMEFGPRALGNRSILASPLHKDMQKRLNGIVKFREDFRPFAPAVIEEEAQEYFEVRKEGKKLFEVMLAVCKVKNKYHDILIGITHYDKSARVQIVTNENKKFYKLLKEFGKISGYSCLINTSFNVKGQPIVENPTIAITTFLSTNIDILCMGNYIIYKI